MVGYTILAFHLPRRNITSAAIAYAENATGIATNTPSGPSLRWTASRYASGISNNQNEKNPSHVGVQVSPAPLNDCDSTMPYAYSTNPIAITRSPVLAYSATAGSDVNRCTMPRAPNTKITPTTPRKHRL